MKETAQRGAWVGVGIAVIVLIGSALASSIPEPETLRPTFPMPGTEDFPSAAGSSATPGSLKFRGGEVRAEMPIGFAGDPRQKEARR